MRKDPPLGSLSSNLTTANPKDFAVAGNWYGICIYNVKHNAASLFSGESDTESPICDIAFWPMQINKTCPAGFRFVHVSAQFQGSEESWVGTCMANSTGQFAEASPSGALQGFCAHQVGSSECRQHPGVLPYHTGAIPIFGSASKRGNCGSDVWRDFGGRTEGLNEYNSGACLKP